MYELFYYYDEWAGVRGETVLFEGRWDELQQYIRQLRDIGCYDITASHIPERSEEC